MGRKLGRQEGAAEANMKRLILFALSACALLGQGIVQQNTQQIGSPGGSLVNLYAVSFNWTGDGATGAVPVTPVNSSGLFQGWRVIAAEFAPRTPAPTAGYSIQLLDGVGVDLLGSAAIALSASAAQSFTLPPTPPPLYGTFSLSLIGNSVAGARGVVVVYLAPAPVAFSVGGAGGGGGGGGAVASVFGRTGAVVANPNDYSFAQLAGNLATAQVGVPQGNGSKVQLSTGSTTLNDYVKFDVNGNTIDGGVLCCAAINDAPGGSAGGDLSGTYPNPGVAKVNGLAVPVSQNPVSTNGSGQFIAPTVQGNGTKVQLSTGSPTANNCTKFDANGNTVDSGGACAPANALTASSSYVTDGTNFYSPAPMLHQITKPFTVAGGAWLTTQGSATIADISGGGLFMTDSTGSLSIKVFGVVTPATPYTITADFIIHLQASPQEWTGLALMAGTGAAAKIITFGPDYNSGAVMQAVNFTNQTTFSANEFSYAIWQGSFISLRIRDDGANRIFSHSLDGVNFVQDQTGLNNVFLTADHYGFVVNKAAAGAAGTVVAETILNLTVTN
jgi:hypothetical protein